MTEKKKREVPIHIKAESVRGEYEVYKPHPILLAKDEMTTQQQRFFAVYLSKIVPGEPDTYDVKFSFDAFAKIAEVDTSHPKRLEKIVDAIQDCKFDLTKYYKNYEPEKYNPKVKRDRANLFYRTKLYEDRHGDKYVEFLATPIMEELLQGKYDNRFVHYPVKNYLSLPNSASMRMYDCLKYHQGAIGDEFRISIETIKEYLGIDPSSYPEPKIFKRAVVKKTIDEINKTEDADIEILNYKGYKKKGRTAGYTFIVRKKELVQAVVEDGELSGQMDIEDYLDEPSEDYTRNPLELTFRDEIAKLDYAELYMDANFTKKGLGVFTEFLPEDVHRDVCLK